DAFGTVGAALRDAGHVFVHPRRGGGAATVRGSELVFDGLVLGGRTDAPVAVVVGARVIGVRTGDLSLSPVGGIDTALGLIHARGTVAHSDVVTYDGADGAGVIHACRRALAHELLGATDAMLVMATEYAKVRTQFGRPIGAFQAVKHRLADV